MLVAVVGLPGGDGNRAKKVRINRTECTGENLYNAILDQAWKGTPNDRNCADKVLVEIYDEQQGEFVSLCAPALTETNIVDKFGTRVRCILRELNDDTTNLLAIAGRFYDFDASTGMEIAGKRIFVNKMANLADAGTGVNVWDSAILLARYLEQCPNIVKSKRVLELGSGCGLVGIVSGLLGAHQVVMTDLPYALPHMRANVKCHLDDLLEAGCEKTECTDCDWFNPRTMSALGSTVQKDWQADVLLLADCVWLHELVAPLMGALEKLIEEVTKPMVVVIAFQRRASKTHEAFLNGLRTLFSRINEVDITSMNLTKPDVIYLLQCHT